MTNREKIYDVAKNSLGKDFSTNDQLGCAETVNAIVKIALGYEVGGGVSTAKMFQELKYSNNFIEVKTPMEGDIILSPTGQGKMAHGHVGIVAKYGILANDSNNGELHEKYTLASWNEYFGVKGGFPVLFYRAIDPVTQTPAQTKDQWFQSSDGSGNLSLTLKGAMIGAIPTIITLAQTYGFSISTTDATSIITNVFSIGSVALMTFGLLKKIYLSKITK